MDFVGKEEILYVMDLCGLKCVIISHGKPFLAFAMTIFKFTRIPAYIKGKHTKMICELELACTFSLCSTIMKFESKAQICRYIGY